MNLGRFGSLIAAAFILPFSGGWAGAAPASDVPADLVGTYDGSQTEMAAGLDLKADGRFAYALSYGAIDEQAEGEWTADRDRVVLTSPPVVPPRFVLLGQGTGPAGLISVTLDLPEGMSRQYFQVEVRMEDGSSIDRQLDEEQTPIVIAPGQRPTAITLTLPMFEVASQPVPLGGTGADRVAFRFEPHDLGKPAFDHTPLLRDGDGLILRRYDQAIRFRRITH